MADLKTSVDNYIVGHNAFLEQKKIYDAVKLSADLVQARYKNGLISKIDYNNGGAIQLERHYIDLVNYYINLIEKYILVQKAIGH